MRYIYGIKQTCTLLSDSVISFNEAGPLCSLLATPDNSDTYHCTMKLTFSLCLSLYISFSFSKNKQFQLRED